MRYENMTLDRARAARVFAAATSIVISTMTKGVAAEAHGGHDHRFGEHGMNFDRSLAVVATPRRLCERGLGRAGQAVEHQAQEHLPRLLSSQFSAHQM